MSDPRNEMISLALLLAALPTPEAAVPGQVRRLHAVPASQPQPGSAGEPIPGSRRTRA